MNATPDSLTATVDTFAADILEGSNRVPVLVDFWAPWCGPCRSLAPVLDRIAHEYAGRLLLAKVNVDEEQALASQFAIRSIPTVLLIHQGRVVDQFTGVQPEAAIRSLVDRHLAAAGPPGAPDPIVEAHGRARAGDHAGALRIIEAALVERPEDSSRCSPYSRGCSSSSATPPVHQPRLRRSAHGMHSFRHYRSSRRSSGSSKPPPPGRT